MGLTGHVNLCRNTEQRAMTVAGNTLVVAGIGASNTRNHKCYVRRVCCRQGPAILHPLIDWAWRARRLAVKNLPIARAVYTCTSTVWLPDK